MRVKGICVCVLLALSSPVLAETTGLFAAYQKALQNDSTFGAALATSLAGKEEISKAMAAFLPTASASLSQSKSELESTPLNIKNPKSTQSNYDSQNYSLNVRQSIFKKSNFAQYKQAKASVDNSDAIFEKEKLKLMTSVTDAYLQVLLSRDNIRYIQAQKDAIEKQLLQANRLYGAGQGTITDISEAQAKYDTVIATEVEAQNALEISSRELENKIGIYSGHLRELDPGKIPLELPEPNDVNQWIELSTKQSPAILASQFNLEAADQEVEKGLGGNYPEVDLVASKSISQNDTINTIGSRNDVKSIGVQVNIPLFSGGSVLAQVRQLRARRDAAREQLKDVTKNVASEVRKQFLALVNGIIRLKALERAVQSNETALLGTTHGFEAGFRTNVEVLNAQQQLFSSKRDLAKARYELVSSRLKLLEAAGVLNEGNLQEADAWFSVSSSE